VKWKEGTKLAVSLRLATAALVQHTVAGADLDFVGPTAYTIFGVLFKKKRVQNDGYKINYESECLCRIKQEINNKLQI